MKNAKKLLGMVLSLCLVLTLLAGFSAAADGDLLTASSAKAEEGKTVEMELLLPDGAGAKGYAKIRGYIEAENFVSTSAATVSVKDSAGTALFSKTYTLASTEEGAEEKQTDLTNGVPEYIRFSGIPYGDGLLLSVEVIGAGAVYVDAVTIEEDKNLVKNPAFDPEDQAGWSVSNWKLQDGTAVTAGDAWKLHALKTDGNCPDGANYVELNPPIAGNNMVALTTSQWLTLVPGEKYIISVWMKGDYTRFEFEYRQNNSTTGKYYNLFTNYYTDEDGATLTSNTFFMVNPEKTDGKWIRASVTVTIPDGVTGGRFRFLVHTTKGTGGKAASFCMPTVEKVENNEVRFFRAASLGTLSGNSLAFSNLMGEELDEGILADMQDSENIKAVSITTAPEETARDSVVIASYKNVNGVKQLVSVTVGERAVEPASTSLYKNEMNGDGVTPKITEDGKRIPTTRLKGVNYPTASMTVEELADADEIRAFAWDSISGLKPAGDYAVLTK